MGFLKKGQAGIEFFILIMFVFFFFVAFLYVLNNNISTRSTEQVNLEMKHVALSVQEEVALASESSDGYSRNFTVPPKILGRDYNIQFASGLVYLNTTDGKYSLAVPVGNVSGQVSLGSNIIKKSNGIVYLNS